MEILSQSAWVGGGDVGDLHFPKLPGGAETVGSWPTSRHHTSRVQVTA